MKTTCPNCGNPCEILVEADGRRVGYCDPAVTHEDKPGCDTSFVLTQGKAKTSDEGKGLLVKITEDMCYQEKRITILEDLLKGQKTKKEGSIFPWVP